MYLFLLCVCEYVSMKAAKSLIKQKCGLAPLLICSRSIVVGNFLVLIIAGNVLFDFESLNIFIFTLLLFSTFPISCSWTGTSTPWGMLEEGVLMIRMHTIQ